MLVIMASYVLALLTNRILLIDLGNDIDIRDLYREPFANSSWALPKYFINNKIIQDKNVPLASGIISKRRKVVKVARLQTS